MTTPNIAVNDAWGTMLTGGQAAGNEQVMEKGSDFMSVMNKTAAGKSAGEMEGVPAPVKTETKVKGPEAQAQKSTPEKKTENTDSSTGRESKDAKEVGREDTTGKTEKATSDTEVKDEVKEAVASKADTVKEAIIAELGISEEDLENVMELLGLTQTDLLNPQVIPQLVAQITGNDISAVLTDENLYSQVNSILGQQREAVNDLMQELDLTKEEFIQTVNTIGQEETKTLPETEEIQTGETGQDVSPEKTSENGFEKIRVEVESSLRDEVRTPAEANPERKVEADVTERKSDTTELKAEGQSQITKAAEGRRSESGADHTGDHRNTDNPNQNITNFVQNLTQSVTDAAVNSMSSESAVDPYVQSQNLLDQIDSQIKLNFTDDATSMELQLHPASLGKINVKLVSANGEVTAQFEAQNASVKAALEGHVAELKQTLQNQGVKIESVEVTLASHEFEQNLMQGQDQNAQNAAGRKSGMRRINLNDADEEELEGIEGSPENEADRIARSMMAANGGSVDFMA